MSARLVLASQSPTRQRLLVDAGFSFAVDPSGIDEQSDATATSSIVLALALAKAAEVAPRHPDALVLGCDSLLDLDGQALGKPTDAADAVRRWRSLRGRTGTLFTGHALLSSSSGREAHEVVGTIVHFGEPTDVEIERYVASGEPLDKAGAFTLEGRSSPFITGIEGDASNVRGLSLAALRRLLGVFGWSVTDLWRS